MPSYCLAVEQFDEHAAALPLPHAFMPSLLHAFTVSHLASQQLLYMISETKYPYTPPHSPQNSSSQSCCPGACHERFITLLHVPAYRTSFCLFEEDPKTKRREYTIVEIKYCRDTRQEHQEARAEQQHAAMQQQLQAVPSIVYNRVLCPPTGGFRCHL